MNNRLQDLLQHVDGALDAWDASPHSWSPGDPLWSEPSCTDACYEQLDQCTTACVGVGCCSHECGHQTIRSMVEEFHWSENNEISTVHLGWCMTCDVGWDGDTESTCWVCGADELEQLGEAITLVTALLREHTIPTMAAMELDDWQRYFLSRWVPADPDDVARRQRPAREQ